MSQAVKVRRIDASCRAALNETVALLVDAFHDSPLFVSAFPRERTRAPVLRTLFDALVDDTARFGGLHIAFRDAVIVGALLWYGPGAYPMTLLRILRQLPRFLAIAATSPRGVLELRRAQQAFELRRPKEPHAQACWLAGRAGERVGVQLARALMREADNSDWSIYLETQNERTMSFYRRMGCELIADGFECFPGAPLTWTMWRRPCAGLARNKRRQDMAQASGELAKRGGDRTSKVRTADFDDAGISRQRVSEWRDLRQKVRN